MLLALETLFKSELLTVRHAVARPSAAAISDIYYGAADILLLPISGVFAKHDSPGQHVIANSNHAVFIGYDKPYRISFPGGVGDESLVLEFSKTALAKLLTEISGAESFYSPRLNRHCLLPPSGILNRHVLLQNLLNTSASTLEIEEACLSALTSSVHAAVRNTDSNKYAHRPLAASRRRAQIEMVKELISLNPARDWTLETLARHINSSPYHLVRIFREEVGVPVHRYLIRARLGKALEILRQGHFNLTDIALEAGFNHHSHFTSSFRSFFGITPTQLRTQRKAFKYSHVP